MITNSYSKSERRIISYFYSFRYLKITQLQNLFHHKYPNRIKIWLRHLLSQNYIYAIKDKKDKTKPYIFCLDQKASGILKEIIKKEDLDTNFVKRLYKEKSYSRRFMHTNLFLVDCYLFFETHKRKDSVINFFTRQDLYGYEYFPKPLPDAYIDEETGKHNNRFFLEVFGYHVPLKYHFQRVEYYFDYLDDGEWHKNTDKAPFPVLLIICANTNMKKKIYYHARSLLERCYSDIAIFLTTKDKIYSDYNNVNTWDEVQIEESD